MCLYNWINECLKDGTLDEYELKEALKDDDKARDMWEEYSRPCSYFIDTVRDEIKCVLKHRKT